MPNEKKELTKSEEKEMFIAISFLATYATSFGGMPHEEMKALLEDKAFSEGIECMYKNVRRAFFSEFSEHYNSGELQA